MLNKSIVMIDFETSGLSPEQGARITEVAALRIEDGKIVDRFVSLINCNIRISSFITQLTGITQPMLSGAPPVAQVIPALIKFIGNDTLAAHNTSFDEKFLVAESQRLGLSPAHAGVICTLKLSRRIFPGMSSYKLGNLANDFGIRFKGNAHRAEADAEVGSALLSHLATHISKKYGMQSISPDLLKKICGLVAGNVHNYLEKNAVPSKLTPLPMKIRPCRSPI